MLSRLLALWCADAICGMLDWAGVVWSGPCSLIVSPGTGDALDVNGFTLLVCFVNAKNHGRGGTG
jgi:hypothetical protein